MIEVLLTAIMVLVAVLLGIILGALALDLRWDDLKSNKPVPEMTEQEKQMLADEARFQQQLNNLINYKGSGRGQQDIDG